jgi:CPA1 family monovalent cation:H+ antiporter
MLLYGDLLVIALDENQVTDSGGIGLLANLILKIIPATSANFTIATLASTYDSFYLAEHIIHVSEIIAVLIATLAAKDTLLGLKANKIEAYQSWEFLAFVISLFMFYLMVLIFTLNMFANKWLAMLVEIMAAFV